MVTKFNPENKEVLTIAESLGPAMEITEQEDADQYLQKLVEYTEKQIRLNYRKPPLRKMTALEIVKENLGYYAGYYSDETRCRVEKLFKTKHPIFGAIATEGAPTFSEAFQKGLSLTKGNPP